MDDDRFKRAVREWLTTTAPTEAPDRILDAVAARVDELEPSRPPRWLSYAAASAAVVVVLVASTLALIGVARLASPAPERTTAPTPNAIRCPEAPCNFALAEGGTYLSSTFRLPVVVQPPTDRWRADFDQPGLFRLVVGGDERRNITIVTDPVPTDALGRPVAAAVDDADGFARWLEGRAELLVSAPEEATVAGLTGWALDVAPDPGPNTRSAGCIADGLCVGVFAYSPGGADVRVYGAASVDSIRLYVLDAIDHVVVVALEARHGAPVRFLDGEAQELLAGLHISDQP